MNSHLTLILGGVRSGKSARALHLAEQHRDSGRVLFVATAEALDEEMRKRIDAHRAERSAEWDTLESPRDLAADIQRAVANEQHQYSIIVIDCITLWVSNIVCSLPDMHDVEAELANRVAQLLRIRSGCPPDQRWIVVSNEVGLGIVPDTSLGRRYRDALGRVNQLLASYADEVTLMVAGIAVDVKK